MSDTYVPTFPDDVPAGQVPGIVPLAEDDGDFAEILPARRLPALTKLLLAGILVAVAFAGGVFIQKQHDAGLTSGAQGLPAGLAGGGFPGGGQTAGGGAASGTGTGSGSATSGPVLVGTVVSVSGDTVTVKDLGGTDHTVRVSSTTTLAAAGADWANALKSGATVSVNGTKADDGSVTATGVTQR